MMARIIYNNNNYWNGGGGWGIDFISVYMEDDDEWLIIKGISDVVVV